VIQPISSRSHVYSSFFFTRCMQTTTAGHEFDYAAVQRWSDRIPGGLANIDTLYIPINRDNEHWLFIQIHFPTRSIYLYDSLGQNNDNLVYLHAALQYLHAEHRRRNPESSESFNDWSRNWTTSDLSHSSPKQRNGYDCGIFMLISMALCVQGITLCPTSYTQDLVDERNIRKRLAHVAWLDRIDTSPSSGSLRHWLQQENTTAPTATGPRRSKKAAEMKPKVASAKRLAARERLKRRRRRDRSKLSLGGTRMKRRIRSTDRVTTGSVSQLTNRKRSAASIAAAASRQHTSSQRLLPPAKKRKRIHPPD